MNICLLVWLLSCLTATAALAATPAKAYVVHPGANIVSVIDTTTGTVVKTVTVGTRPVDVAVTRDGSRAYVANAESDSVSVIDTSLDQVVTTVSVADQPSAVAVTPDGRQLYVMTAAGVVEILETETFGVLASIPLGASGRIAFTPDGTRAYVAAGLVHVIDTATRTVIRAFPAETSAAADVTNTASSVAISPDGSRAYVGVVTFVMADAGFSAGGSVLVVDTASDTVSQAINLFSLPRSIVLTPDGGRAYVGIESTFVNTGYGMGFFPGRHLVIIDTIAKAVAGIVDFGAAGPNWTQQNTAAGIGVATNRSAVYAAIPRLGAVAVADVNTSLVTAWIPVTASPGELAVKGAATLVPYVVLASDDSGVVPPNGGTAVANVLANDRLGGLGVTPAHVKLTQRSSTSSGVTLKRTTGAVTVAAGTPIGEYSLVYRICELASLANCDQATVTVTVRPQFVIDAVNDSAASLPGRTVLATVLANDTLGGAPATTAQVKLSQLSSTTAGLSLDTSSGAVLLAAGTTPGPQKLTYRICEIVSPGNCDTADVAVTVNAFPIDAVDDSGFASRTGGTAVANVLANDRFAAAPATLAQVRLSQVSSSHAGVTLNATGAVVVAAGTPAGIYSLVYRICEIATPSNCDNATVAVTVQALLIRAVNDVARGSSKLANTPLASVLTNDRLGSAPATLANVRLAFVSLTPANGLIRLDLADGSVDVLGKTDSGSYALVYEICERADPANCSRATVAIDLSGR